MGSLKNIKISSLLCSVLAILLVVCILMATVGRYVAVKVVQWDIRRDMAASIRAGLPEDNLVLIKIFTHQPPKDFVRVESHEFRYQGGSYDIVREEIIGDSTYFYCVYDERETALYANMDQHILDEMSHNPERQKQRAQLLENIPKFYFVKQNEKRLFLIKFGSSQMDLMLPLHSQFSPQTSTPPPDLS